MKKILLISCFMALVSTAFTQVTLGVGATYLDNIGAQARISLPAGNNLAIIPQASYYFVDGATRISFDANFAYDIAVILEEIPVYFIGGVNLTKISFNVSDASISEYGLNLGGGTTIGRLYGEVFYRKLFCNGCSGDIGFNLGYMF